MYQIVFFKLVIIIQIKIKIIQIIKIIKCKKKYQIINFNKKNNKYHIKYLKIIVVNINKLY